MKKLIYLGAEWCSACKALKPTVEREIQDYDLQMKYVDMDSEEAYEYEKKYNIRSLPTIIVLDENDCKLIQKSGSTAWREVKEIL